MSKSNNLTYLTNLLKSKPVINLNIMLMSNEELLNKLPLMDIYTLRMGFLEFISRIKHSSWNIPYLNLEYLIKNANKDRKGTLLLSIYGCRNFKWKPEKDKFSNNSIEWLLTELPKTSAFYYLINEDNFNSFKETVLKLDFDKHKTLYAVLYGYLTYTLKVKN